MTANRVVLSLCLISAAAAAATVWLIERDRYTATFQFRVLTNPDSVVFADRKSDRGEFEIYKNTQKQLITSKYVLDVASDTATEAALLVAAVSKAYLDEVVNLERLRRSQRLAELWAKLTEMQDACDNKRASLRALAKQLGIDDQTLSHRQRMTLELLAAIRKELIPLRFKITQMNVELNAKKTKLDRAMADPSTLVSESELERAVSSDLVTQQLKNNEQNLAGRRKELEGMLQRRAMAYLGAEVGRLESELAGLQGLEQQYQEDEAKYSSEATKYGGNSLDVERLQREIDAWVAIIKPMTEQAQKLKIELGRPSRVQRMTRVATDSGNTMAAAEELKLDDIAQAIRPRSPDPNARWLKTIIAAVVGFLAVPLVLIVLRLGWLIWQFAVFGGRRPQSASDSN